MLPYFRITEPEHNIFSGDTGFKQVRGNPLFCMIILNPYFVTDNLNMNGGAVDVKTDSDHKIH